MGQIKMRIAEPASVLLKAQNMDVVKAVSPTATVERNLANDGVTFTVTDVSGEHSADIYDGQMDTSLIGDTENENASRAYGVREAFLHGGKLYKVTAPIAEGEEIQPGVNCEQVTLIEYIQGFLTD